MIAKVRNKVKIFLKETTDANEVRVVRVDKIESGWIAEAEVAAKNQFLASIKPEYRVFEKEHYVVKVGPDYEVSSYRRVNAHEDVEEILSYGL
jgi:hypothetical protein